MRIVALPAPSDLAAPDELGAGSDVFSSGAARGNTLRQREVPFGPTSVEEDHDPPPVEETAKANGPGTGTEVEVVQATGGAAVVGARTAEVAATGLGRGGDTTESARQVAPAVGQVDPETGDFGVLDITAGAYSPGMSGDVDEEGRDVRAIPVTGGATPGWDVEAAAGVEVAPGEFCALHAPPSPERRNRNTSNNAIQYRAGEPDGGSRGLSSTGPNGQCRRVPSPPSGSSGDVVNLLLSALLDA
jgi:hypothetical protein